MSQWNLTDTLTFTGNTEDTKMVADIATVAVKPVLQRQANRFGLIARAKAENPQTLVGMGTARFRITKRLVYGTDYQTGTGITRQTKGGLTMDIPIDQTLTFATPFESFDISRFRDGDTAGQMAMVEEWVSTLALNFIDLEELLLMRAHQDFCLATFPNNPNSVYVMDLDSIANGNSQQADKAFYDLYFDRLMELRRIINSVAVGIDNDRIFGLFGLEAYGKLSQAYTKFIATNVSPETLASGQMPKDTILGTPIVQSMFLEQDMPATDESRRMNKDIDFYFAKTFGMFMFQGMWAFARGLTQNQYVQNYNDLNMELVSKNMLSMPTPLYPWAGFIIRKEAPTLEEIKDAQSRLYDANYTAFEKSFQLPTFVKRDFTTNMVITNNEVAEPNNEVTISVDNLIEATFSVQFQNGGTDDAIAGIIATKEIQNLITAKGWTEADIKDWLLNRLHLISYGTNNYAPHAKVSADLTPTSTLKEIAEKANGIGGWTDGSYNYLQAYIDTKPYTTGSNKAHPVEGTTGAIIGIKEQINVILYSAVE